MNIVLFFSIYALYVVNAGSRDVVNARRGRKHQVTSDVIAADLKMEAQREFCEAKGKWTFAMDYKLIPFLKKEYDSNPLKQITSQDKLEEKLEGSGLPQNVIKEIAKFIHEMPETKKKNTDLYHIMTEHAPLYIKKAHDKIAKLQHEIDEMNKKKELTKEQKKKLKQKIDSLYFDHPEHTQLITIKNMEKNPELPSSIYYEPSSSSKYEEKKAKIAELNEKYKNIKIPPIPPSILDDYEIDNLWVIPSYDYDFEKIQWTQKEINAESDDERKKEMQFENRFFKYWQNIYKRRKQDGDWIELVKECMHYPGGVVGAFKKASVKNAAQQLTEEQWYKNWNANDADIIALKSYSDFDQAQREFSKTFRENYKKNWQNYIIWKVALDDVFLKWTKYCNHHLKECGFDKEKAYYHGFTHRCHDYLDLLIEPYIDWKGPISTSTSDLVADNFRAMYSGQRVQFDLHPKSIYYPISMSGVSTYAENEFLFYNAKLIVIEVQLGAKSGNLDFPDRYVLDYWRRKCLNNKENRKIYQKESWYEKMHCNSKMVERFSEKYRYGDGNCEISQLKQRKKKKTQRIHPIYNEYDIQNKFIELEILTASMMIAIAIFCFVAICGIIGVFSGFVVAKIITGTVKEC